MSSAQTIVGVMSYMTQSTAATNVSFTGSPKKEAGATGFDDIINNMANAKNNSPKADISGSKDMKKETLDSVTKADDTQGKPTETITANDNVSKPVEVKETNGKEADKELQNAIEEDGKKLIEEIAEMADVSVDEILAVMQMLGMTPPELLDPQNIIQVVNVLNTSEEGVNLIVDADMYSSLKDILTEAEELTTELVQEFEVTPKEIEGAIEEIKADTENVKEFAEVLEAPEEAKNVEVKPIVKEEPQVILKTSEENITEETLNAPVEHTEEHSSDQGKNKSGSNLFKNEPQMNPFNQLVENIADAAADIAETRVFSYTDRAQMENIVRQITDRITVMTSAEETSMELQLHPASLGNVNILLTSSKDGITAKFTAQNEIVKEAVESQMTALMQKFDEQGVKVTSVEVTIASHAFEQNLQQDDQGEAAKDQMEKNRKPLRRINLAEIDEGIEEEMTQAELIAAQMMAYNGNMVDFSA